MLELRHPHDRLLMQGKKTAILAVEPLPVGEPLEATGGTLVLGEPARMLVSEVDRKEWFERHRVRRAEREAWFPGATRFLVYPVERFAPALEDWRGCDDPKSFGNEEGDEMPYKLEKRDDEFCVVKEDDGSMVPGGCHPTKKEAEDHLTALRINVEAGEKQIDEPLSDEQIDKPLSDESIDAVESAPEPVIMEEPEAPPTGPMEQEEPAEKAGNIEGLAKHLAKKLGGDPGFHTRCMADEELQGYDEDARGAICAKAHKLTQGYWPAEKDDDQESEKAGRRVKRPMLQKLRDAFSTLKEMLSWAEYEEEEGGGFDLSEKGFAVKRYRGQDWIWTWTTNAFKDRDKEIFSTKGLERYVQEADRTGERGRYNLWHVRGTEFADVEVQGVVGRFLVEGGPFHDTAKGKAAKKFFRRYPDGHPTHAPDGWGCSPEFRYLQKERDTGVFETFWITDRAILPRWAAANVQTKGGSVMALTKKQEELMKEALGEDEFQRLVQAAEKETEELEQDLDFKAWDAKKVCKRLRGMAAKADDGMKKALESLASQIEGGDEDEEEDEEEEKKSVPSPEIDLEALAGELAKHFDVDISPLVEQAEKQAQVIEQQGREIAALKAHITKAEKARGADLPRFVLGLEKRASEAAETVVEEGDPLLKSGPAETLPERKSGAAVFFPAAK